MSRKCLLPHVASDLRNVLVANILQHTVSICSILSQGLGYNYHQWKLPNDSLRQVSGLQPWQYQCDCAQNRPYSTIVAPSL